MHRICEKHQGFVISDIRGAGRNPGGLSVKGRWQRCQQLPGEGRARALEGGGHVLPPSEAKRVESKS